MSYIKPKKYYQIAEQMGEAYARIRDNLNNGSTPSDVDQSSWTQMGADMIADYDDGKTAVANDFVKGITSQVVSETDDNSDATTSILHSDSRDPIGSIASDLGNIFKNLGEVFNEAQARTIAASFFSTALKALNAHVISKTPLPPTNPLPAGGPSTMRNINEYYAAYSDDPRSLGSEQGNDMALFTWQDDTDGDYFTGGYFSSYFVDLCSALNITINDEFKNETWA